MSAVPPIVFPLFWPGFKQCYYKYFISFVDEYIIKLKREFGTDT